MTKVKHTWHRYQLLTMGSSGACIKALVISLYYGGNMTQGKLLEFERRYWYFDVSIK